MRQPGRPSNGSAWVILLILVFASPAFADDGLTQAITLFKAEKYDEAKLLFEGICQKEPNNAEAAFYLGKIWIVKNDYEKAIDCFQKAIEICSDSSSYHLWLGNAYGIKAQDSGMLKQVSLAKKVKKEFEKAVELNGDNIEARSGLMQYYLQAPGIMGGSDEKALFQANEIKKRNLLAGCNAFAQIYTKDKKYDLAEKEYLSAINQYPDSLDALYGLGFLYQQAEYFDKAFQTYESILTKKPDDPNALYQVGRTASLSGKNLDRAETCLLAFLQLDPKANNVPPIYGAHYRLGTIYELQGKKGSARQEYEASLKIKPDYDKAKDALKKLK